jgi:hypothetical protein
VSKEATIQARVLWAKKAEDVSIAMHNLASMGDTLEATKIQLVADQRMGELVRLLEVRTRGAHASANQVVAACDDIIAGRTVKQVPLVSLGQGDYRRDFYEDETAVKAGLIRSRWAQACARSFRRLLGVA